MSYSIRKPALSILAAALTCLGASVYAQNVTDARNSSRQSCLVAEMSPRGLAADCGTSGHGREGGTSCAPEGQAVEPDEGG